MMKHRIFYILLLIGIAATAASCHDEVEYKNNPYGNFDALWTSIDEHYCFFKYKDVNWKAVGEAYRAKLQPKMTDMELFAVCSEMLKELKAY